MCFSILGSTERIWCCSSARPDTPTVQVCEFHVGLLVIETANLCCSWSLRGCISSLGSLLSSGGSHVLCSLSPHGATLIGWDVLFVRDRAFRGVSAANHSCKVCLNGLEASDSFHGGRNTIVQGICRYQDHVLQN
jgi:hypothetical protein